MLELLRNAGIAELVLGPDEARPYGRNGGTPGIVVAPRSREEASLIMQTAVQQGWFVQCAGAGTRLPFAPSGMAPDLLISSRRMTAITEYEPADLVATAQAGVTLEQLSRTVARHGQFLALDPAVTTESTLGATVASGAAGPLRFAHGTPRDQVLGLEIVSGEGRVLHFGGKVVKNVAGYDLVRPLIGSRGTLGFITEISVRLKPEPEADRTAITSVASAQEGIALADALFTAHLDAAALELISPSLAAQIGHAAAWTLLVRLHGNRTSVAAAYDAAAALARPHRMVSVEGAAVWRELAAAEAAARVNIRLAQLQSQLPDTLARALGVADAAGLHNARVAMHAGDGIVRLLADGLADQAESAFTEARSALAAGGGSLILARAPRALAISPFGQPEGQALMAGIKKVFDPAGILGRTERMV